MIYILIGLLLVKYRHDLGAMIPHAHNDVVERMLEPGAGLDYQEPAKRRHLRVVK